MNFRGFNQIKFCTAVLVFLVFGFIYHAAAQKVRLRGTIKPNCTVVAGNQNSKFADIYGDGNIAVQGSFNCRGAFIYDISNPEAPTLAAHYNPTPNQQFLEAVVIGNRAYFGSGNGGGVHIVDLTNPASPQLLGIVNAANGNAFDSVHEMVVFNQNGQTFLIENLNSFSNKLLKVINVSNPAAPVFVRDINPTEVNWIHAMHLRGNRMYTSGWGNSTTRGRTEIYDISNIAAQAPTLLGFIEDPNAAVTNGNSMHSSWTSEDGKYLYSCREVSNSNGASPGDVRVYNVENPAVPLLVKKISMNDLGLNAVTPHNPVVLGNLLFVAWYQAGLQVFDLTNPIDPVRVGQYDTFPAVFAPTESESSVTDAPWDLVCANENLQNSLPTSFEGNWAVFPFLGQNKILAGDMANGLFILDVTGLAAPAKNTISDFDGDGKTDVSVFTPNSGSWTIEKSLNGATETTQFGAAGDLIEAADFDGDNKSDLAVFRPSLGTWFVLGSTNGFFASQFGAAGDIPVAADYDADGRADFAVYRPSSGNWFILQSTLGFRAVKWGISEDKPVVGDFEGDGKADFTVWRPSNGTWYIMQSSSSLLLSTQFGAPGDKPLSGDFNGDGRNDISVYRPADGGWYILNSPGSALSVYQFGISADVPVPADYDGDGKTDVAVFRASAGAWYRLNSSNGAFNAKNFGQAGDIPSPSSVQP